MHLYARSMAFERYLEFAEQVWRGPFIIDSADAATRSSAALLASELGYADRAIYNSISLATDEKEAENLRTASSTRPSSWATILPSRAWMAASNLETGGQVREKVLLPWPGSWDWSICSSIREWCRWAAGPGQLCAFAWRPKRGWACPSDQAFTMRFLPGPGSPKRRRRRESAAMQRQGPCSYWPQPTFCFTGPLKARTSSFRGGHGRHSRGRGGARPGYCPGRSASSAPIGLGRVHWSSERKTNYIRRR